jgi:regulator of protease activity HflC (stomatin/prohibitin superfamily)
MSWLSSVFGFFRSFQFWVTVAPWESGLRVRYGTTATLLNPGLHWRIPFLDRIFVQPVRLRTIETPTITFTTKDDKTLSVRLAVMYRIDDIKQLHMAVANPESTLLATVQGLISTCVSAAASDAIKPETLTETILQNRVGSDWGLCDVSVVVMTFAFCRTLRLLMQDWQNTSTTNFLPSTTDPT